MTDREQRVRSAVLIPPQPTDGGSTAWGSDGRAKDREQRLQGRTSGSAGEYDGRSAGEGEGLPSGDMDERREGERRAVELVRERTADEMGGVPGSLEVSQSLARLEMSTLEVKLYLDSIDQRISRIEPRLEEMRTAEGAIPGAAEPPPRSATSAGPVEERGVSDGAVPAMPTNERRRRAQGVPVERRRPPYAMPVATESREPVAWGPWLQRSRSWAPPVALALLASAGLIVWGSLHHPQPKSAGTVDAGPVLAESTGGSARKSSAGDAGSSPVTGAVADGGRALDGRAAGGRPSVTVVEQGVLAPPNTAAIGAPVQPGTMASSDAARAEATSSAAPAGGLTAADPPPSEAARPGSASSGRIIPPSTSRVQVSSGVMAGNLLYSRQPAYPHGIVGLFHTQGKVVMQAIISKGGRVENLRVLSGHYMLRGPAKDAVRTWRYRPYYVNGGPVEVATIVSVEFRR